MRNQLHTLLISSLILGLTGLAVASQPAVEAPQEHAVELQPGYTLYLQHAPMEELDATVNSLPRFAESTLFLSPEGLFRYAYLHRTGLWLSRDKAAQALKEPHDPQLWGEAALRGVPVR